MVAGVRRMSYVPAAPQRPGFGSSGDEERGTTAGAIHVRRDAIVLSSRARAVLRRACGLGNRSGALRHVCGALAHARGDGMSEPSDGLKPTYYVRARGVTTGPHEIAEMQAFVKSGRLTPSTKVSQDGTLWTHAGQFWEAFQPPERPKILRPRSHTRSVKPAAAEVTPPATAAKPTASAPPMAAEISTKARVAFDAPYIAEASSVMTWSLVAAALLGLGVASSVQYLAEVSAMINQFDGTVESLREIVAENQARNSGAVEVLQAVLGLGLCATYLAWQFFASRNLSVLRDGRMRFTPWAGIGWYFMPIGNLWKPYQVMREIVHRSEETASRSLTAFPSNLVLAAWWVIILVELPVGVYRIYVERTIFRALQATPTELLLQTNLPKVSELPGLARTSLWCDGVDGVLTLVACLLTIWIVVAVGYLQYCAFRARARRAD
ncbi:MAG: hypothetical protein C0483_17770 [Pirellula sp.]|nr:hypothetical protein [Pirellula sp.]